MKLKNMVLFSFLCMFIVPAAIILSIRYSTTDKIYEGLIENRLNDALEANEKAAESVFEVSRGVMRVVAEAAGMNVPLTKTDAFNSILWQALQAGTYIDSIYISLEDGYHREVARVGDQRRKMDSMIPFRTKWSSGVIKSFKEFDGRKRKWKFKYYKKFPRMIAQGFQSALGYDVRLLKHYVGAKKTGRIFNSPPVMDPQTNTYIISIGIPIIEKKKFVGFVGANISLASIDEFLNKNKASQNSTTFILGNNDQAFKGLSSVTRARIFSLDDSLTISNIIEARTKGSKRRLKLESSNGNVYHVSSSLLSSNVSKELELIIVAPDSDFFATLQKYNQNVWLASCLVVVVGAVVIYLFSGWLASRIQKVTFALKRTKDRTSMLQISGVGSPREVVDFQIASSELHRELISLVDDEKEDGDTLCIVCGTKRFEKKSL